MAKSIKKTKRKLIKPKTAAKREVVDGIEFRSRLEAQTYRALQMAGIKADYEKHKFVLVEGFTTTAEVWEKKQGIFKARFSKMRPTTYTPDFVDPDMNWIIEVKGRRFPDFNMKWKLLMKYLKGREMYPSVYMISNLTQLAIVIKDIKENQ